MKEITLGCLGVTYPHPGQWLNKLLAVGIVINRFLQQKIFNLSAIPQQFIKSSLYTFVWL